MSNQGVFFFLGGVGPTGVLDKVASHVFVVSGSKSGHFGPGYSHREDLFEVDRLWSLEAFYSWKLCFDQGPEIGHPVDREEEWSRCVTLEKKGDL